MKQSCSLVAAVVLLIAAGGSAQQLSYSAGQRVVPAYEGWEKNPDGSINLLFGYMNQNWDEEIDIPVGPDNSFSPGPADQGQPTHFLPRRNRFVFKTKVAADLPNEVIWTLTSGGKTTKAYASLKPDYFLEQMTLVSEKGGIGGGGAGSAEARLNKAPVLTIEGETRRTVKVGQPVDLIVEVKDDGVPKPRAQQRAAVSTSTTLPTKPPRSVTVNSAVGLRVSWYVLRGAGKVTFDPPQIKVWEDTREGANSPWAPRWTPPPLPPDGRILVQATFLRPGTYVLRCLADDGGLWDDGDVTVTVTP